MCNIAFKCDSHLIKFIPREFITEEIQLYAVKRHPISIIYIENPSFNVCLAAARGNEDVLRVLNNEMAQRVSDALKAPSSFGTCSIM